MSDAAQPTATNPLVRLPDGTVKQVNPLSGTQVWTVPGRADRPLPSLAGGDRPIDQEQDGRHCAFCEKRYLDTTPEKARLVRDARGWHTLTGLTAEELDDTIADFRLIPNLFEIVSVDYWRLNHGLDVSDLARLRHAHYARTPAGRAHLAHLRQLRSHTSDSAYAVGSPEAEALATQRELGFFGGFHDVVVARRHFVDGATREDQLASSGTLSAAEHREYIDFTVGAMEWMFEMNPLIRNVAAFQNWLRPAGASFDHLHKQVVGLDALGQRREEEISRLAGDPDLFQHAILDPVEEHGLWVAETDSAVAFVGIGHLFPSIEVWAKRMDATPWELTPGELDGWSDLLHAIHVATGSGVPTNEEWHYRPPEVSGRIPLRAIVKWRINTPAGFEGGTKIHINTIDPWSLRGRVQAVLAGGLEAGAVAETVRLKGVVGARA